MFNGGCNCAVVELSRHPFRLGCLSRVIKKNETDVKESKSSDVSGLQVPALGVYSSISEAAGWFVGQECVGGEGAGWKARWMK